MGGVGDERVEDSEVWDRRTLVESVYVQIILVSEVNPPNQVYLLQV